MRSRLAAFVVCLSLALAASAFGQGASTTSTLSGVVVDSAGGVVPGAEVTIKHNATGVTQSAVSNAEGAYLFPSLPIGTYTVTVRQPAFGPCSKSAAWKSRFSCRRGLRSFRRSPLSSPRQ